MFPSFLGGPSGETLLYRSARPRGWVVLELDRAGSVTQRAAVNAESTLRPLVLPAGDGHLKLVWPGSEAEVRLEPREVEPR